jgi:zinc/manganese transport system ATP-binding protein
VDRPEVLAVEDVSVDLGGRRVLDRVSFGVEAGQLTGLIGSNGAGKTTLLRVVLGLQRASSGRVLINGVSGSAQGGSVGYVPQRLVVDPDMPLRTRDLVALGLDGHRFGLPLRSARRHRAVEQMLEAVDAQAFADTRVGHLSGGELQRVLIAHALIARPDLLLLDEPLAGLDLRSAQEIIAVLDRITEHEQVSVLISAHEMNALLPVMDRVVYLAAGRAASGPTDQVIRTDVLSRLYGHDVEVVRVQGRVLVVAGPGGDDRSSVSPIEVA